MAALTVRQFVQCLSDSGLFSAEELASLRERVPPTDLGKDSQDLARELVKQGSLTRYQAALLYQGKSKALVLGNYVVLDKLGQGGMGMVLKAQHRRMLRTVALKVLPAAVVKSTTALKRFHREAQAAAKLSHPNIVAAYDADEAGGVHFLVMEYVEGEDLGALIKRDGPFSIDKALYCVREAAKGLAYAHSKGVIHRDIKPANLLLSPEGALKILDMGLARIDEGLSGTAETEDGLTKTGQIMGTVDYMAPEQAEDTRRADARADIYSLGCTLYRLLVDEPPYIADTLMLKLLAHREHAIPDLRARRADAPAGLQATFARMVAKKPADRFQTMEEVLAALAGGSPAPPAPPVAVSAPPVASVRSGHDESNADLHGFLAGISRPSAVATTRAAAATQTLPGLSADRDTLGGAPLALSAPRPAPSRLVVGACVTGAVVVAVLLVGMVASRFNGAQETDAKISPSGAQTGGTATHSPSSQPATDDDDLTVEPDLSGNKIKAILAADNLPPNADADFNVQGEYELTFTRRNAKIGVQIVALGNGAFRWVKFAGGLPGAGADLQQRVESEGKTVNGAAQFSLARGARAIVHDGLLTLLGKTVEQVQNSTRVQRVSPAAGKPKPKGATALFNGKSTAAWVVGRTTADGLLLSGCESRQKFRDFKLFFEFRLPYLPHQRGQARGNSGCYLQNRYELQLLDSFGLKEADNGCGAFYALRAPDINMCFPPFAWQTMEIDFTAARFDAQGKKIQNAKATVLHNGVPIHRDVQLLRATTGGQPEADTPGPIVFQNHGTDVHFRNVWIVDRSTTAPAAGLEQPLSGASGGGFKPLFNGHSLAGWHGDPKLWSVQNGVIVGSTESAPISANSFLVTDQKYHNFILRASFKLQNGNSGIQFRGRELPNFIVSGYQADIVDSELMGALYEERGQGVLARPGAGRAATFKRNDWNELEVTANDSRIQIKLNGTQTVDFEEITRKGAGKGVIALQLHASPRMKIQFKDLWICELPK